MKRWTLALPLLLAAVPARAQDSDVFHFVLAAPASTGECSIATAHWIDFTDLLALGPTMQGRCVAIDGYWRHHAFYGSRKDADRAQHGPWGPLQRRAIGIYADWDAIGPTPREAPQSATIVGIMDECSRLRSERGMVLGYCHERGGPFIRVSQMIRD